MCSHCADKFDSLSKSETPSATVEAGRSARSQVSSGEKGTDACVCRGRPGGPQGTFTITTRWERPHVRPPVHRPHGAIPHPQERVTCRCTDGPGKPWKHHTGGHSRHGRHVPTSAPMDKVRGAGGSIGLVPQVPGEKAGTRLSGTGFGREVMEGSRFGWW